MSVNFRRTINMQCGTLVSGLELWRSRAGKQYNEVREMQIPGSEGEVELARRYAAACFSKQLEGLPWFVVSLPGVHLPGTLLSGMLSLGMYLLRL